MRIIDCNRIHSFSYSIDTVIFTFVIDSFIHYIYTQNNRTLKSVKIQHKSPAKPLCCTNFYCNKFCLLIAGRYLLFCAEQEWLSLYIPPDLNNSQLF